MVNAEQMRIKKQKIKSDYILDAVILFMMWFLVVIVIYPFLNALAISLNDANDTVRGGITVYPRILTFRNYELIFTNNKIYNAYYISIARTLVGIVSGLLFTSALAYGISRPKLIGRKLFTIICLIPMYFGGGLIPYYFLITSLKLVNTFWVYIIPALVSTWNMILMRTYFLGIPGALEESARIDGANYITIFFMIIIPISTPMVAAIALFIGVAQWNSWFDATMFISNQDLKPMQSILISIINEARFAEVMAGLTGGAGNMVKAKPVNVRSITMATMMITILPIVIIYPFLQRYFIKGIMVGSIKE